MFGETPKRLVRPDENFPIANDSGRIGMLIDRVSRNLVVASGIRSKYECIPGLVGYIH